MKQILVGIYWINVSDLTYSYSKYPKRIVN
jgi:hypothetical protein